MKLEAKEGQVSNSVETKAKATKKEKVETENPTIINTSENTSNCLLYTSDAADE